MFKIVEAASPAEITEARKLFREYSAWLRIDLCFQNFEKELAELPGAYAPPRGRLLFAVEGERVMGCIALRPLDEDVCEMKRLFVRPEFQGRGLGRILTEKIIEDARSIGYRRMRLDTIPSRMGRAVSLYRSFGFQEIAPYYQNPTEGTLYMELKLS